MRLVQNVSMNKIRHLNSSFNRIPQEFRILENLLVKLRQYVYSIPHTVAMTISKCAMSATRCMRSGAMRFKFSLANSHDGKM